VLILLPILTNLLAVITGIRAVGDGRDWSFKVSDIFRGAPLAKVYVWLIFSTCFSLVHLMALLTQSAAILGPEINVPVWLFLHTLIGLFFTSAHLFVDAIFEDRWLAQRFLGIPQGAELARS
jgi:hypothetical protein